MEKAKLAAAKVSLQEAKGSLTQARVRAKSLEAAQKKAEAEDACNEEPVIVDAMRTCKLLGIKMVPRAGVEPARPCGQWILSPFRGTLPHATTRYQAVFTDVSAVKASYVRLGPRGVLRQDACLYFTSSGRRAKLHRPSVPANRT